MVRSIATILFVSAMAFGQTAEKLEFEVVSVKPSAPPDPRGFTVGCHGGPGTDDPTLLVCQNWDLFNLVAIGYGLNYYQVSTPGWMHDVRYDVRAKVPDGTIEKQIGAMWQKMLTDRFRLVVHRETKEFQVYDLALAKGGPKFKRSGSSDTPNGSQSATDSKLDKDGNPSYGPGHPGMSYSGGLARMYFPKVTIGWLASFVSGQMGAPVNDTTGLDGDYGIGLYWASDSLVESSPDIGPRLVDALRDQLGLRLVSKKGPLELLVVDHAERVPSDN